MDGDEFLTSLSFCCTQLLPTVSTCNDEESLNATFWGHK